MSPSLALTALTLAKYLSSMLAGTETLEMSRLVEVATRYLWLTLLMGQPLSLWGPVTRIRPVPSCFSTITRLPLWTPARTMAIVPALREALSFLAWLEKKFLEVPFGAGSTVGTSLASFL